MAGDNSSVKWKTMAVVFWGKRCALRSEGDQRGFLSEEGEGHSMQRVQRQKRLKTLLQSKIISNCYYHHSQSKITDKDHCQQ